jgi:hypothetical protein
VKHFRSLITPFFSDDDWVLGVYGLCSGLALSEPDTATATQINGRDYDHWDSSLMFELNMPDSKILLVRSLVK